MSNEVEVARSSLDPAPATDQTEACVHGVPRDQSAALWVSSEDLPDTIHVPPLYIITVANDGPTASQDRNFSFGVLPLTLGDLVTADSSQG
jgi:hypothetical protein